MIAFQTAADEWSHLGELILTAVGAVVIVCGMWWLYFDMPTVSILERSQTEDVSTKHTFAWGYGHFIIFMAAAAVGAGVGVVTDVRTGHADASVQLGVLAVGIPVAIYALSVWALHCPIFKSGPVTIAFAVTIAAVLVVSVLALPIIVIGLILVGLIVFNSITGRAYLRKTQGSSS